MSKMVENVKTTRSEVKNKRVENFMGGGSFKLNPIDTLKIVTSSSIFGEPSYYRNGEFAQKTLNLSKKQCVNDHYYYVDSLVNDFAILPKEYEKLKTSDLMEKIIDKALDYDFDKTLEWAIELRKDFRMRLNPQVIMVRASNHSKRKEYTSKNPGKFNQINMQVMSRLDEPSTQFTYWLYKNKSKKNLPTILKKSWAKKYEKTSENEKTGRYYLAKYKNAGIGIIDTVRVCHANSNLIDELMKTGTIKFDDDNITWESLKSQGKTWKEILSIIKKFPHMALIRNLRNIFSEIDDKETCDMVLTKLKNGVPYGKQFPFRYYTAKKFIEQANNINFKALILDALEECMDIATDNMPKLKGKTMCLTDNSGSAWGAFNSQYGTVTVADIGNLSSVITAKNSDEGYVGVFGDRLNIIPVSKRNGILTQHEKITNEGKKVGMATENGIWLFFKNAIENKEHWDNIFIYSDQQAGHGGLYGTEGSKKEYRKKYGAGYSGSYIDIIKLINKYRSTVNSKVNIYTIQTSGYDNVLVPSNLYRTSILSGWSGDEIVYADVINKQWDEIDNRKQNK